MFKPDSHWMTKMKSPNENDIAYSDQLAVQKIKVYWYINLQIPLAYYIFYNLSIQENIKKVSK